MNTKLLLTFSLFVFSCGQAQEAEIRNKQVPLSVQQTSEMIPKTSDPQILIPGTYRDLNQIDFKQLNANWLDLSFKENKWQVTATNYRMNRGYDECIGDSTTILTSPGNPLILFTGISANPGILTSVKIKESSIPPNRTLNFSFNSTNYMLSGMGSIIDQNGEYLTSSEFAQWQLNDFQNVKIENYMLSLSDELGKSQLVLSIPQLGDGVAKLLWIGDLDNDGLPDFIFDTSANEEEKKVELFLSHPARADDFIKKAAEVWLVFDC